MTQRDNWAGTLGATILPGGAGEINVEKYNEKYANDHFADHVPGLLFLMDDLGSAKASCSNGQFSRLLGELIELMPRAEKFSLIGIREEFCSDPTNARRNLGDELKALSSNPNKETLGENAVVARRLIGDIKALLDLASKGPFAPAK